MELSAPSSCSSLYHQPIELPILYGTAWKGEATRKLVHQAIVQGGFRGVDTAAQLKHYREDLVGEGLQDVFSANASLTRTGIPSMTRRDIWIQTKFSPNQDLEYPEDRTEYPGLRTPFDPNASLATQVEQSVCNSLRNLRVEQLDSLLLHSPCKGDMDKCLAVWDAFRAQQSQGRVRFLGLSNIYDVEFLLVFCQKLEEKKTSRVGMPTILQNRFARNYGYDDRIRSFCRQNGVVYQPFWTLTANKDLLVDPFVQTLARNHEGTVAQCWYALVHGLGGIQLLCGSCDVKHMQEAVEAANDSHMRVTQKKLLFTKTEMDGFAQLLQKAVQENKSKDDRESAFVEGNQTCGLRFVSGRSSKMRVSKGTSVGKKDSVRATDEIDGPERAKEKKKKKKHGSSEKMNDSDI